jgi:ribokinase
MYFKKILVIGSTNTDMVIQSHHLPAPGETILGGKFFMNPGGKGANQAVAAARLGGKVTFVTKTGNDIFGKQSVENFENEGINTDYLVTDPDNPSGVALITVDEQAENCIVVAPGSNSTLSPEDVDKASEEIEQSEIVLMQLEIPVKTVEYAAQLASKAGCKVILNPAPAPADKLTDKLLKNVFILTPNESEAELLTGIKVKDDQSSEKAAKALKDKGVDIVVLTRGAKGAYLYDGKISKLIPAPKVKAVDTTAAGDTFNGALAVAISEGMNMTQAIEFANKAAAITVTRLGAQSSTPYWKEMK